MAYDALKPADDQWIAQGPEDVRINFEGLRTERIVDAGLLKGYIPGNLDGNIPISNGIKNVNLNADLLDGLDSTAFAIAEHTHNVATISDKGFMSSTDKTKLDGIETGAQVNKFSFNRITIGSDTIQADSQEDELILIAGIGISIIPNISNDTLTITGHSNANDPSVSQKEALLGTSGVPSNTNRYVTNSDSRMTNARNPIAHNTSHISGGSDVITPLEIGAADLNHTHTANEIGALSIEGGVVTGNLSISGTLTIENTVTFNNSVTNFSGFDANGRHVRIGPPNRTLVDRVLANDDSDKYVVEIQNASSNMEEIFSVGRGGVYVRQKPLVIPFILDDSLVSTTSTSFTPVKLYRWYKHDTNGCSPRYLKFNIGTYVSTNGNASFRIRVGSLYSSGIPVTNTSESIRSILIDISSLANGLISIELQMLRSSGTIYSKYFECDMVY